MLYKNDRELKLVVNYWKYSKKTTPPEMRFDTVCKEDNNGNFDCITDVKR